MKSRAAVTKLLDAINNETFQKSNHEDFSKSNNFLVNKIPTNQCVPWKFANRMNEFINDDSCSDLIDSIKHSGQKIPAIARKTLENNEYEIICGIRRLYTCRSLGIPLLVAIVSVSDKEALLIMDVENRSREDISPYERAIDYKNWIDSGIYKNYKEIQEQTGIKKSWFSQLMSLAELNPSIIDLFGPPKNLKQKWGYTLRNLCKTLENEQKILKTVEEIKTKNYHPRTVYSKLLRACSENNYLLSDELIVKDDNNNIILKTKTTANGGTNLMINKHLENHKLLEIVDKIKSLLE